MQVLDELYPNTVQNKHSEFRFKESGETKACLKIDVPNPFPEKYLVHIHPKHSKVRNQFARHKNNR